MKSDLILRNLSEGTAKQYIRHVAAFARHYGGSPAELGTEEMRGWLLGLQEPRLSPSTRIVNHAALRFLYDHTLGRPEVMATVPRPRRGRQALGVPLVREDVLALLPAAAAESRVHRQCGGDYAESSVSPLTTARASIRRPSITSKPLPGFSSVEGASPTSIDACAVPLGWKPPGGAYNTTLHASTGQWSRRTSNHPTAMNWLWFGGALPVHSKSMAT